MPTPKKRALSCDSSAKHRARSKEDDVKKEKDIESRKVNSCIERGVCNTTFPIQTYSKYHIPPIFN